MQDNSMRKRIMALAVLCFISLSTLAQVNSVEFGRNRVQHKKFTWKFYESPNFYTYFTQGGLELGKYAAQTAESELKAIETQMEYSLQSAINIVVYNNYNDFRSTNIGLSTGIVNNEGGGLTKLVNNKMPIYFDGNHAHLRQQIREGIAKVLLDNMLFGSDVGEFASNHALLDLPQWLTDGYVSYVAERWNTTKDDDLKNAMLGDSYKNFYQFAFDKPMLAGAAFWYYIDEKYKKENVSYFLYLARIYKSLNAASIRITKKKFKTVLAEFMDYQQEKYYKDLRQRRNVPKGTVSVTEDIDSRRDFFRFQANPNPRNQSYVVVQYKKGIYSIGYYENYELTKTLLKYGVRSQKTDINPTYPIMAWDGKGTRVVVIYWENGKIKMFVYDTIAGYSQFKQEIEGLDQVLDVQYLLDKNTLLLTAVKNGHTDIFTYKIDNKKLEQLTNDVYDDLDASFVAFPNKTGIIFASNRPSPDAPNADTVLAAKSRFNIFMLDYITKKQITQLTNIKFGNARYPMQYNVNHFTYVSDENGIANRWAGFFTTQREGLDTLFYIGDEVLRNPTDKDMDSTLVAWQKNEPDSMSTFQMTKDSTYTFPITNYQSNLLETRIAGDRGQVSEVTRQSDMKFLYKLRVDSVTLRKRNINARPTEYMKKLMSEKRAEEGKVTAKTKNDAASGGQPVFQSEFENEKKDTANMIKEPVNAEALTIPQLKTFKLFNYRLKFSSDYIVGGVSNNILINRYQPYAGGSGPIQLGNGANLNFTFRASVSDLLEDIKFVGGFRLGTNLTDNEYLFGFQNYRKRFDWGVTYYRVTNGINVLVVGSNIRDIVVGKQFTNLYQFNGSYPLNEIKSIRLTIAYRRDRAVLKPIKIDGGFSDPQRYLLSQPDILTQYALSRIEYVHDNTINPSQNIWHGLRYKVYMDANLPINDPVNGGKFTFNFGFDGRHYLPIYRNFIWAVRAAGDFSWGAQKIIYYAGGVDGWLSPKFNNLNTPAPDQNYAFQSLAVNLRGFNQNVANGNNALIINSEFRLPVFATLLNKPINNAFVRNFQLVQFFDLGSAWNGKYDKIERPTSVYSGTDPAITFRVKAGGIGPLAGGYGFGARSTLLGYFLKLDAAWEMNGIFKGKPVWYFALGFDF